MYGHNVNFFDSTANDWAVTGVQLEIGDVATPFEHRSFGDELAKCQRYFFKFTGDSGAVFYRDYYSTDTFVVAGYFPTTMRAAPTISTTVGVARTGGTAFDYINLAATPTLAAQDTAGVIIYRGVSSSARTYLYLGNPANSVDCSAEL